MIYDCIIAGGGPAGSICSLILQKHGFRCLLLEKRTEIDEKICGGFLPNRCREQFLSCGVDLSEILPRGMKINGYIENRNGKTHVFTYKKDQFGMGIFRKELDSFLLQQTEQAGTEVVYGEYVAGYERTGNIYWVNGYPGKNLVWATGAVPPLKIEAFVHDKVRKRIRSQSMGISEIIRTKWCSLESDAVYFWYTGDSNDYFWAIPVKEDTWNIGYWSQRDKRGLKKKFSDGRKKWIESAGREISVIRDPRGALLGNADFSECLTRKESFCCGDLAGTDYILTGEGIAQAVRSAKETAYKIIRSNEKGGFL